MDLGEAGYRVDSNVRPIAEVVLARARKPVIYTFHDVAINSGFRGGFREFADCYVVTFDPLVPGGYTLAHEYAHLFHSTDQGSVYLDPDRVTASDGSLRSFAGLIASVTEHPTIHKTLVGFGFDTCPEARSRTAEGLRALTPALGRDANTWLSRPRADKQKTAAQKLVVETVQLLTTYHCEDTPEFEKRARGLFNEQFFALVDTAMESVTARTDGAISMGECCYRVVKSLGRQDDVGAYFVDRAIFESRLRARPS